MKITAGAILLSVGGAAAWSQPTRGSLRSLGQKQVVMKGPSRVNGNTMKMEGALSCFISVVHHVTSQVVEITVAM